MPARPKTAASDAEKRDSGDDGPPPPKPRRPGRPTAILPADAVAKLRKHGGKANGVRDVAKVLGTSKSAAHRVLHRLAAAGQITMTAGPQGHSWQLA